MKKYNVTITEALKKTVEVEAESQEEAEQKIADDWYKGEYILDADNFTEVNFEAGEKAPEKMRIVLLEPDKTAKEVEIGTSLKDLQDVVGGLIEPVYCFDDAVCMIVNEEGKMRSLPLNRGIYDDSKKLVDIIAGTAFICDCSTDRFKSLSDEQIEKYKEQFRLPEKFFKSGDEIKAVPYRPKHKNQER